MADTIVKRKRPGCQLTDTDRLTRLLEKGGFDELAQKVDAENERLWRLAHRGIHAHLVVRAAIGVTDAWNAYMDDTTDTPEPADSLMDAFTDKMDFLLWALDRLKEDATND